MAFTKKIGTWSIVLLLLGLCSGCGFQLRGSFDIPQQLNPAHIQAEQGNLMARALREVLLDSKVDVVDDPKQAKAVIRLLKEDQDRRVGAVDSRGKVVEFALTYRVEFDLIDAQGKQLLPRQDINLVRNQVNPDVEVLGKQEEQALFFLDMRREMADRILGRVKRQLR
jgi:LPS-assembly lipoprotein